MNPQGRCSDLPHIPRLSYRPRQESGAGSVLPWPSTPRDALEFAMAELPEREQAGPSFDTLYTLAKKTEVRQPSHTHKGQGSSDAYRDKYRRYPTPAGQVTMLTEEELLPPDPEPLDPGVPELDIIQGMSLRMTQAMNHYQREEHCCFVCGATDHFTWDCLHQEAFRVWHKDHLNFKGADPQPKEPAPKSPSQK